MPTLGKDVYKRQTVATAVIIVLFLFHYRDEDLAVFSLRGHDFLQNRDKEE